VDTEGVLLGALEADPAFLGYLRMPDGAPSFSAAAAVDEDRLVFGDIAGRLVLFDLSTNERLGDPVQVGDGDHGVRAIVTDPSGTLLAIAFEGTADVRVVELDELERARPVGKPGRLLTIDGVPNSLALDQAGRLAVGDLYTGTARVIDVATGNVVAVLPPPPRATGADINPQNEVGSAPETGLSALATAVAFAPDDTLATGQGSLIRLWRASDLGLVAELRAPDVGVGGALKFSPDGDLVSAAATRVLYGDQYPIAAGLMAWDIDRRAPLWPAPADVTCLDVAVIAKNVVCGLDSGEAIPFDLRAGTASGPLFDLQLGGIQDLAPSLDRRSLVAVATNSAVAGRWSLDGRSIIAPVIGAPGAHPVNYSPDGSLLILNMLRPGSPIQLLPRQLWDTQRLELWKEFLLFAAVFTPDGRLAVGFENGSPGFLDPRTGSRSPLSPPHNLQISSPVAFDSVRQRMAFGYADGVFDQRDLVTGRLVGASSTSRDVPSVTSMAYLRGGSVIAVARGGQVEFLDADSGAAVLEPVEGQRVAASPDGSVLVTSTIDGDVTVRDPATARPTAPEIAGAGGRTNAIELSNDNTRMLVVTWGGAAHLYDVGSTRQIGRTLHVELTANVAQNGGTLRPDGQQLAVATEHGVQLWDLDPDVWREAACRLAGRNLTRDEWERYMPQGEPYRATCSQWPADPEVQA